MGMSQIRTLAAALVATLAAAGATPARAAAEEKALPRLVTRDGRHALLVDGEPFLILGAQCHNSSAWPAMLPKVWPAVEYLQANTLEAPVYWEQFEPEPGRFDTSVVDGLVREARENDVRLVLLWFGTWKNGSSHYVPLWMKRQPERYPRLVGKDGRRVDSPSPHARATLDADVRAFQALMRRLKEIDTRRTVIMVQVENEPGTWGSVRDYSPLAEALFEAPVPAELLKALGKGGAAGDWKAVFGADADEFFHAWSVGRFVGQVAAAGKAEYPLPLYANAALRDPIEKPPAGSYESGGPTDNVLDIWKAAAPAIDVLAPDIYMSDGARYRRVLELYRRPDNPLFVPENGGSPEYARHFFTALGHQAIGWAPFGVDYTAYADRPIGAPRHNEETLLPFALNYRLAAPIARELARLSFDGKLHAVAEEKGEPTQAIDLGRFKAVVTYGVPAFGFGRDPRGNPEPVGRALVGELGGDRFLVAGYFCRVDFQVKDAASGAQREYVRVEEGRYEQGVFRPIRIWNGDETDWGLNFSSAPQVLQVSLGTY
jgi:beta-galactosidase GanA